MSDTLYHSGVLRTNLHKSGLAVIPLNAIGAIPVFATREEAEADNEAHGMVRSEVGMMEQVQPTEQEPPCDNPTSTPAAE